MLEMGSAAGYGVAVQKYSRLKGTDPLSIKWFRSRAPLPWRLVYKSPKGLPVAGAREDMAKLREKSEKARRQRDRAGAGTTRRRNRAVGR